jgi:ABC-type nitrate/sulfonate/bicarbonate transport system ATPase subunit
VTGQISVVGLSHAYGLRSVLDDVSFDIAPGGLTALIGPTGCGKSTILRILAGLLAPDNGSASMDGRSILGRPGECAYMPQGDTLLPWRRARANAMLGAQIAGYDLVAAHVRTASLFTRFGLAGFEESWPRELSGGMRQRVALLRTVLTGHPVLLLDEPFAALDAVTRTDLQGWLSHLLQSEQRTTLLVTHDVDETLRLADQILVLSPRPGRIVDQITLKAPRPRDLLQITEEDFTIVKRRVLGALFHSRSQ